MILLNFGLSNTGTAVIVPFGGCNFVAIETPELFLKKEIKIVAVVTGVFLKREGVNEKIKKKFVGFAHPFIDTVSLV